MTGGPLPQYRGFVMKGHRQTALSPFAHQIALIAVLLWAVLPAGLMPARTTDGAPVFALCSGDGPVLASIGSDGRVQPVAPLGDGHDKDPCPFAGAGLAGLALDASAAAFSVDLPRTACRSDVADDQPASLGPRLRPAPRAPPYVS